MIVEQRSATFAKDQIQEDRLRELNDLLAAADQLFGESGAACQYPVTFIVGCPRTGSTLLAQLLARSGLFGYVNNFAARFWRAPWLGVKIYQALGLDTEPPRVAVSSSFGRTEGWAGPHEFGYFWDYWFQYGETSKLTDDQVKKVDSEGMHRALVLLERAWAKPLFFKNQAKYSLNIALLNRIIGEARFVHLRREPLYVAQSILLGRQSVCGDMETWWSTRPDEYHELNTLDKYQQIAGQIFYIEQDIKTALQDLPAEQHITVDYDQLCADPRQVLCDVARLASVRQIPQKIFDTIPATFQSEKSKKIADDQWQGLQEALKKFS